jgi:hypothetical protein
VNPWTVTVTEGGAAARPTIVFLRGRHHRADVGRSPERFADHQCLAPDLPCQAPFTTVRYRHTRAMVASQRSLLDWGGVSRRHLNSWVSARATVVLHAAGRPAEVPVDTAEI